MTVALSRSRVSFLMAVCCWLGIRMMFASVSLPPVSMLDQRSLLGPPSSHTQDDEDLRYTQPTRPTVVELDDSSTSIPKKIKFSSRRGVDSNNMNDNHSSHHAPPVMVVVDILSIGSLSRSEFQQAQNRTMGSHTSVRNFFTATELDDIEPHCSETLQKRDMMKISKFCVGQKPSNDVQKYLANFFARWRWLEKKTNPAGWMCAQKRPVAGLSKVLQQYKNTKIHINNNNRDDFVSQLPQTSLPDYLLIIDDDTFVNMEAFLDYMAEKDPDGGAAARVMSGCLVKGKIGDFQIDFPYGGFGTFFSRKSLSLLMKPIHCPKQGGDDVSQHGGDGACSQIYNENLVHEAIVFDDGMSLIDLMMAYQRKYKYGEHRSWKSSGDGGSDGFGGYCFHSDWYLGYFVNYYNVSDHVGRDGGIHNRIHRYKKSRISGRTQHGNCNCVGSSLLAGTTTKPMSDICHYMTPNLMEDLWNRTSRRNERIDSESNTNLISFQLE